uniref:Uncharacterized protein n=1 Tax=Rhizophora mucronata TaxID=61149 RepID=A0A2P2NJG3_RHIMU
MAMTTVTELFV